MIRFYNLPVNEEAADNLVREMRQAGYKATEARPIVESAASVTLALLRSMDAMIEKESTDEARQTMIQQLVMHQIISSMREAMKLNAFEEFMRLLRED